MKLYIYTLILVLLAANCIAGPGASLLCMGGCNAAAVACYASAGAVMGTVTAGVGIPAAIFACNAAQGVCMAACAAMVVAPTP